jgi:hypothetical protein
MHLRGAGEVKLRRSGGDLALSSLVFEGLSLLHANRIAWMQCISRKLKSKA